MTTSAPPDLILVKSRSGAMTHVMDRRYAPLARALCGAAVRNSDRPAGKLTEARCKKCRDSL